MKDGENHELDDDVTEHGPEDLAQPNDTEDAAMQKLARRMSKIMGISEFDLLPRLRRLVVAVQLRDEVVESKGPAGSTEA